MEETFQFLKINTQVNYLTTINGDKPSCRPFGDPVLFENKINKNISKLYKTIYNYC